MLVSSCGLLDDYADGGGGVALGGLSSCIVEIAHCYVAVAQFKLVELWQGLRE